MKCATAYYSVRCDFFYLFSRYLNTASANFFSLHFFPIPRAAEASAAPLPALPIPDHGPRLRRPSHQPPGTKP